MTYHDARKEDIAKDKTGVKYVEVLCNCVKTRPAHLLLRQGIDSRYYVGQCYKCKKRHVLRVCE